MSDLNIMVATADGRRLYAALEAAIGWAALGKSVRMFLQGEAAALLRAPIAFHGDDARKAAGQPDLEWMVAEAGEMEVRLYVCQSGLALVGMTMADIKVEVTATGLIGFMSEIAPGSQTIIY